MDGIEHLRVKRGTEQVDFMEIADHFCDYIDRYPNERDMVDRLAHFLAAVRDVGHNHDADPDHGLAGIPAQEAPHV